MFLKCSQAAYTWDSETGCTESQFWRAFWDITQKRYRDYIYNVKMDYLEGKGPPQNWTPDVWAAAIAYWDSEDAKKESAQAKTNRLGTRGKAIPSRGGTVNLVTHNVRQV